MFIEFDEHLINTRYIKMIYVAEDRDNYHHISCWQITLEMTNEDDEYETYSNLEEAQARYQELKILLAGDK